MNENECRVLDLILKNVRMSQVDISKNIGISKAAVSKIVSKLKRYKLISEISVDVAKSKGRPKQYLVISNSNKKIIGINFSKDLFEISLGSIYGEILKTKTKKFFMKKNMTIVEILLNELDSFIKSAEEFEIIGIGICVNGIVDSSSRTVLSQIYYKWENLNLAEIIEKRYNIPVIIESNIRAILKAEMFFSQLKDMKNLLYLYIKDGISLAIMIDNKILLGDNNRAGQITHYRPAYNDNKLCECSKKGCINSMYSENTILLKIQEQCELENRKTEITSLCDVYEKLTKKDETIEKIVSNISKEIGNIMGNVLNILDITNIIVAGDIIYSENIFLEAFSKGITENFKNWDKSSLHYSKLGKNIERKASLYLIIDKIFTEKNILKNFCNPNIK